MSESSNKKLIERLHWMAPRTEGPRAAEEERWILEAAFALEEREGLEAALRTIAAERFFYCNKCGYMGKDGPGHIGCSYLAAESDPSRIARAALNLSPVEGTGCERCGGRSGPRLPCPDCTPDPAPTQPSGGEG